MATTTTNPTLRDYRHASKLFVADNFKLIPKFGFLFHVFFDINTESARADTANPHNKEEIGLLVKSIDLPKFNIDTKIHNAYNRPNIVQSKIKYEAISATFHDDSADVIRNFWFDYYNYYYRDADYAYNGEVNTYTREHKYNTSGYTSDWGFTPRESKLTPYLNCIRIYSLHHKKFSEYVLVNPLIKRFSHGQHAYDSTDSPLAHEMQIEYESVIYNHGYVSSETVSGFATLHYDNTPSPLQGKVAQVESSNDITTLGQSNTDFQSVEEPQGDPMDAAVRDIPPRELNSSYPYSVPNDADSNADGVDDAVFKNSGYQQDDATGVDDAVFKNSGYQQDDATGVDDAVFKNSGYQQDDATGVDEAVAEQQRLNEAPSNYNPTMPDEIEPMSSPLPLETANNTTASDTGTDQGATNANSSNDLHQNLDQLNNNLGETETNISNATQNIEANAIALAKINTQYQAAVALSDLNPAKQGLILQYTENIKFITDIQPQYQEQLAALTAQRNETVQKIQTIKAEVDSAGGYQ